MNDVLWQPGADARSTTRIGRFLDAVEDRHGISLDDHEAAWRWSVDHLEDFWGSIVEHFDVTFHTEPTTVLGDASMPGAAWFPDATLNYAEQALDLDDDMVAIIARSQSRDRVELTGAELKDQVARCRAGLQRLGVGAGDRVGAFLPNIPETIVAFLATASLGAIWSSCAPEFGTRSVVDRFQQIDPKVLLTVDGYRYGDKDIDKTTEIAEIREALDSLEHTVVLPYLAAEPDVPDTTSWADLLAEPGALTFAPVAFDHPLYVLYSSGTTGLPKPIIHGHGGILVEHLKALALYADLGPGDRFFWFTTTGWMMWNFLVSGLLVDTTLVLFDGNPGHPDLMTLWRIVAEEKLTYFGTSAPFLMSCRKAGLSPGADLDLSALEAVGSTGAPLPPAGFHWVYEHVGADLMLSSVSGGTDVCTAFVGGCPIVEVREGEIPCRYMGARVEAYDEDGTPVVGQRGELVVTAPMPSMPVGFWGDEDGSREREAYFSTFPGVWRHGDWITITERGSCVITGRSDATLNRGGVRLGTSEFYAVVDSLPEVADSLVVHLEDDEGGAGELLLFVTPIPGEHIDDEARARIRTALRENLSPRHVPDDIREVPGVPRTLSGKRLEVPIKRILTGTPAKEAASRGALANPESLDAFQAYADERDPTDT